MQSFSAQIYMKNLMMKQHRQYLSISSILFVWFKAYYFCSNSKHFQCLTLEEKILLEKLPFTDLMISNVYLYLDWMFLFLHCSKIFPVFESVTRLKPLVRRSFHRELNPYLNKNCKISMSILQCILIGANFP